MSGRFFLESGYALNSQLDCPVAFIALCSTFSIMRLAVRKMKRDASFGWDDYLVIPSLVAVTALCGFYLGKAHSIVFHFTLLLT